MKSNNQQLGIFLEHGLETAQDSLIKVVSPGCAFTNFSKAVHGFLELGGVDTLSSLGSVPGAFTGEEHVMLFAFCKNGLAKTKAMVAFRKPFARPEPET